MKTKEYIFFKPSNHTQDNFAIQYNIIDNNCKVLVFYSPILQSGENFKTGDKINLMDFDLELCFELDVWNKYFFPKFSNNYQWYHTEKYIDDIGAVAEVMEYVRKEAVEMIGGAY